MSDYYEILEISSDATVSEIETALDAQYHYWRRRVTHYDPAQVNKANQKLHQIEQIRATLTDPQKRATYDTSISGGVMSGLADPNATLQTATAIGTPPPAQKPQTTQRQKDAWVCTKCLIPNAVGTQFCAKCGTQVG